MRSEKKEKKNNNKKRVYSLLYTNKEFNLNILKVAGVYTIQFRIGNFLIIHCVEIRKRVRCYMCGSRILNNSIFGIIEIKADITFVLAYKTR